MQETLQIRVTPTQLKIVTEIMERARIELCEVLADGPDYSHVDMRWEMLDDSTLWVEMQFFLDRYFRRRDT